VSAQLPLVFREIPHNGTDTSVDAARSVRSELPRLEALVLGALRGSPAGATAEELEAMTCLRGNTVRPRLVGLRERGMVEDSGGRRATASGRLAVIWRAVQ
jgi:hypothetical protein